MTKQTWKKTELKKSILDQISSYNLDISDGEINKVIKSFTTQAGGG